MERYLKLSHDIIKSNALTPSEFRVLVYLMCFDPCHPSHKNIANQTGLNYKTVNRALKSLNTKGLLFWTKGNSFGKNNAYKIYPNAIKKLTKDYPQNGVSSTPKKGSVKGTIRNFENIELENLDKFSQLSKEELAQEIDRLEQQRTQDLDKLQAET